MSLVMPEEHEEYFRQQFRLEPGDNLPNALLTVYWRTKRLADASSIFFDQRDLMWIALQSGHPLPNDEHTFLHTIEEKGIEYGATVICNWRKGRKEGVFQGVSGDNKILVLLNGDADVREFDPAEVWTDMDAMIASKQ